VQQMPNVQTSEFDSRVFMASTPSTPGSNSLSDSGYVGGSKETVHLDSKPPKKPPPVKDEEDVSIVRVCVEEQLLVQMGNEAVVQNVMYKCIRLDNSDKTTAVIRKSLLKHQLPGEPADYHLVQLLPDGSELPVKGNCNVFYALCPPAADSDDPLPILELRKRSGTTTGHQHCSSSGGFTMRQLKNKDNRRNRSNLLRWSSGFL